MLNTASYKEKINRLINDGISKGVQASIYRYQANKC